jgi:hypothetical protein
MCFGCWGIICRRLGSSLDLCGRMKGFVGGVMTELPTELVDRAKAVREECIRVSSLLADRADRVSNTERLFLLINNSLGALALIAVSFDPISAHVPKEIQDIVTILAGAALVIGPYLQSWIIKDPPSRYKDYVTYISGYANKITSILTDVKSRNRYEKLIEILNLADQNITGAKTEWKKFLS